MKSMPGTNFNSLRGIISKFMPGIDF